MLGIIIGVGAVISMLALGAGTQKEVLSRYTSMGTNLLIVRPGNRGTGGVMSGTQQNLTLEDSVALLELENVKAIAPVVGGNVQAKYFSRNARLSVLGTTATYFPMRNFEIETGRMFTEQEAEQSARVAVLGPTTVENLFGPSDPLGETIKLNGINFRVIGVMKGKGDQGFFNPDDQAILPYTVAMKQVLGQDRLREIDIEAEDVAGLNKLQEDATALLRKRHRIQPGNPDDFSIRNQAEALEMQASSSRTFTILMGGISSISLLVGGIGIMNIMLVTVTERTREIGVRKAIGAKDRDILTQFLLESLLMSGLGGVMGVGFGYGTAYAIQTFFGMATIVEPSSVILSLSFAAGVGIVFGLYPAWRAARLDPIVALRYE
jgi:putative ABC transport system permease protein